MNLRTTFSGLPTAPTTLVSALRPEVQEQQAMVRRFVTEAQAELTLIRAHHQALVAELATSRTLIGEVRASLASMTDFMRSLQAG
jgi:hypothetical protein